jgi:hypothetical protein
MNLVVYLLCATTSLLCAVLLLRGYRRWGVRLLLWSGLCFIFLFISNSMVVVDYRLLPQQDLALARVLPALIGLGFLLYGLVWDSQ